MSWASSGAVVGAVLGAGLVLVLAHVRLRRRPSLEQRVVPYLGLVGASASPGAPFDDSWVGWGGRLVTPTVRAAGVRLDEVLGGTTSLRHRLARAGRDLTPEQFRLEQLAWGAGGFAVAFVLVLVAVSRGSTVSVVPALVLCCAAGLCGVLGRDQVLNREVARRIDRIEAAFPPVAELLALAVAAGEGAAGAFARVSRACSGELADELRHVLDDTRTGAGLADALRAFADRIDVTAVSRFVDGVVIAVERGTPLADVLRAQAADARDVRRRQLMEVAGRREIAMLVPVVFLILPITVLFALFPGFYGLNLSVS